MPFTVITLTNAPPSLRGDLTKWMQEIATGVYVGNFNTRTREQLWERVKQSVGTGEATMSFAYRNEIGYQFDTLHTQRQVIDFDGIPLVMFINPAGQKSGAAAARGYSNAAKFRKANIFTSVKGGETKTQLQPYVVLDIETNGLDENKHGIIEIGAIKKERDKVTEFHHLIRHGSPLSTEIIGLTGITDDMLATEGKCIVEVLTEFLAFVQELPLVGYGLNFDLRFINKALKAQGLPVLKNIAHDLLPYVKREKKFLDNYKLETVLLGYDIQEKVPHRALEDARLIYLLSTKVNKFQQRIK